MAHGEVELKVLQLVHGVLGGVVEPTPSWLLRPGIPECGDSWSLINRIYHNLTSMILPETMPIHERRRVDCVLKVDSSAPRIIEVDEKQHFNHYRARTLRLYSDAPLAFDPEVWIKHSEARKRLETGGFGKPKPPLFPDDGGRHRQRAFRDALCDIVPLSHGFAPTLRIAYFEVLDWLTSSDAAKRMKDLLDRKLLLSSKAKTTV